MEHSKILMTGATGFLGSNLAISLVKSGFEVHILKRSTSNLFRLSSIVDSIGMYDLDKTSITDCLIAAQPDIVIHCATDYGRKDVDPSAIIEANLILPLRLLEQCRKYNVKSFINTDTFLDKGINFYSLSKKQFKEWLDTYASNLICVNVVLEHFYGPFDDKTKFVSFVIDELLRASPSIDLTEGHQKRDFIYIEDVVKAFRYIIDHTRNMAAGVYDYGIGTNNLISIRDLVEITKKISDNTTTTLNFGAIPYRRNEIMSSHMDTNAIRSLGWVPEFDIIAGLSATIELEKKAK